MWDARLAASGVHRGEHLPYRGRVHVLRRSHAGAGCRVSKPHAGQPHARQLGKLAGLCTRLHAVAVAVQALPSTPLPALSENLAFSWFWVTVTSLVSCGGRSGPHNPSK